MACEHSASGWITLYHRTDPASASLILRSGSMRSKEHDGACFFSTRETGQNVGYGETAVKVRVPVGYVALDDEFPDGEQHYRVTARSLRPEWFIEWRRA